LLFPGGWAPPFQPVFWPWLQPDGVLAPCQPLRRPVLLDPRDGAALLIRGPLARPALGGLNGGAVGLDGPALGPPPGIPAPPPGIPGPPAAKAGVVTASAAAIAAVAKIERIVVAYSAVSPESRVGRVL
jgi:hypothetical protein